MSKVHDYTCMKCHTLFYTNNILYKTHILYKEDMLTIKKIMVGEMAQQIKVLVAQAW